MIGVSPLKLRVAMNIARYPPLELPIAPGHAANAIMSCPEGLTKYRLRPGPAIPGAVVSTGLSGTVGAGPQRRGAVGHASGVRGRGVRAAAVEEMIGAVHLDHVGVLDAPSCHAWSFVSTATGSPVSASRFGSILADQMWLGSPIEFPSLFQSK